MELKKEVKVIDMNVNEVDYTINLVKNLNETVIDKKRKEVAYWIGVATTV